MTTRDLIAPIINETYGAGSYTGALIDHLTTKIDGWPDPYYKTRTRGTMIMLICWDWMSGGDTAASVANKIEAVLPPVSDD
jgi:hypothetical protein